jgi:organic hydroperoxide reductase OsmC/OhrA
MSHRFSVDIQWKEGLRGESTPRGVPATVAFSVPPAFGGPGGEWTPEHFYAAGIATCIMATFLSIARNSKLALTAYTAAATATMEETPQGLRMSRVEIEPRIVVASEADRDRALRLIQKAEAMCPISHSTTAKVTVTAAVEIAQAPAR